ncbi:MAG: glycosyltransferase family 39 protein [Nitrospirae bacterium YQR-1]
MKIDKKAAVFFGFIFLIGAFFFIYRLDSRILWEDESATANLAVNILKYGIPLGDDGKNRLIFNVSNDLNEDSIWVLSPWLSEYLTAGSFAIFGKSEFAARLPFAVLGFLSVIFLFYVVWDIFKDRQLALLSLLLSVTSEVLILHSRQCRYYAVSVFMQVLFIFAFYLLLQRKRIGIVYMFIALTCQFYSSYLFVPGNLLLAVTAGFILRKKYPGVFGDLIIAAVIVSSLGLIWVIYAKLWNQTQYIGITSYYEKLLFYIMQINMTMFPLLLLLLLLVFYRKSDFVVNSISRDMMFFILAIIPFQIVFIINYFTFFLRYIIILVPVFIVLQSLILRRSPPLLRYTIAGILCLTNFIGYTGLISFKAFMATRPRFEIQRPRVTLKDIFMERVTPYVNRSGEVIAFLNKNTLPGQSLLACGSEFPVIFYTQLKVINLHKLKGQLTSNPDWIFPQSVSGMNEYVTGKKCNIAENSEFLKQNYEPVIIEVHNSWLAGSVADPDMYEYFTTAEKIPLIAYKKKG